MQITYDDKVTLNENTSIADINKIKASDMNMIKQVVNANQEDVGNIADLKTTDVSSIVNAINEIIGNYKPISLYENAAGTNGNINLSDNASNYKYIEIYYFIRIAEDSYSSVKCYDPNGKEIFLFGATNTVQNIDFNFAQKVVKGTQITTKYHGRLFSTFGSSGMTFGQDNNVWITKVVGYKYE